ncbi:MAG: type transport system ATP-binding protein [Acidobacteriota bacterium]|jgi:ABC-type polysaccharide/polyol phosphate transport system ATPase subunit|nr:type transport system ATP-binding protein [Acidobacteriota bacterium]
MSNDVRISLDNVSLCYRLAKQRIPSIKEYAIHWMKGALSYEKLWALRDVDLTVREGETVGIVGRNGAGKSTLLKVISRVLKPSQGKIEVRGMISPILELGTGFDHELTGLENIYLNALLLGRSRRDIQEKLEEIVDFSGLGDFIRSPIRNYSSGMLARLGFSIATAWMPEILILDEVLSVGDAAFTEKCEKKMSTFHNAGITILVVSHSDKVIRDTCTRCIWLDAGNLRADGEPAKVLDLYMHGGHEPSERAAGQLPRTSS